MTEREMLLRVVCENPDDDTPRLVFADWLDENGEPERAEFIRIQVASAREPAYSTSWHDLVRQACALLAAHAVEWRANLPTGFAHEPFVRGFLQTATIGIDRPATPEEVGRLFDVAPVLSLTVYRVSDPGMLADIPVLARLRSLWLQLQDPPGVSVERFLTAPNLTGLERIYIFSWPDFDGRGWNIPPALYERFRSRFGELLDKDAEALERRR